MDKALLKQERIMHPVIMTHITNADYAHLPIKNLEQLLEEDNRTAETPIYRTRFCVEGVYPGSDDPKNLVKIYNKKTGETRAPPAKPIALKDKEKYMFHIQLYVKDYSNALSNQFVRVFICEEAGKAGGFFRNIKPEDVLTKKDA